MAKNGKIEYKLAVVGTGGVGKSCISIQFINNHFVEEYDPTIEDCYMKQVLIDGEIAMLEILDTAGQEEYSALREQYLRQGEGFLFVYATTSRSSFQELESFVIQLKRVRDTDSLEKVPIVIVGNKCDLETQRQVSTLEASDFAKAHSADFFETSALKRVNIDESFFQLVRNIRKIRGQTPVTGPGRKKKSKKLIKVKKCSIL